MSAPVRIAATDSHKNRTYLIRRGDGGWQCVLSNGTPAALSYAGFLGDEMAARFSLEDTKTADEALAVCRELGARTYTYELVTPRRPTPAPAPWVLVKPDKAYPGGLYIGPFPMRGEAVDFAIARGWPVDATDEGDDESACYPMQLLDPVETAERWARHTAGSKGGAS